MSTDVALKETIPENVESEDPVLIVLNEMKNVQDKSFNTDDNICPGLPEIIPSSLKAVFNDVKNTVEQMLKDGNRTDVEKLLQEVKGYSAAASCFALIKAFSRQVLEFYNGINKKEHSDRLNRIKALLDKVNEKLDVNNKKVDDLGEFLKKLLRQGYNSRTQEYIEFGLQFDLIVVDLDSCAADLVNAKNELNEGFASIKRYLTQRILHATGTSVNGIGILAIATRFATGPLLQLIGVCCAGASVVGVGLTLLGVLVYIGCKLYKEITFAQGVKAEYKSLDAERKNTETSLVKVKSSLEALGNAGKLAEEKEENTRLKAEKDQDTLLKAEKDEEIARLKAEIEAMRINKQL